MPLTVLQTEITNLGIDLDDVSQAYWTTPMLTMWINQGMLEIARKTECLLGNLTEPASVNQNQYPMPADMIRIHEVTFSPLAGMVADPTQTYPLTFKGRQEMNTIWYINQSTPASYPIYYTTWQFPPVTWMQVYPVPAQPGQFTYFYYRTPRQVSASTDYLDIPEGTEPILRAYVRYNARRRAGDPAWQDDLTIFQDGINDLLTASRNWTDNAGMFTSGGVFVPGWLYGGWGS